MQILAHACRLIEMLLGQSRRDDEKNSRSRDGAITICHLQALPSPGIRSSEPAPYRGHEIVSLPSASILATPGKRLGSDPTRKVIAILADPVFS